MTQADFLAYMAVSVPDFAADKVASGDWSADEALALAQKSFDTLLPQGLATPDNHLFNILDDKSGPVGTLWVAAQLRAGQRIAYVYDVIIGEDYRRKGHGERAFIALETTVRSLGLSGIALHVFGHNRGALALYTKLGFHTTDINMFKALQPI